MIKDIEKEYGGLNKRIEILKYNRDHFDMVEKYGIKQAPTLVIVENGEFSKFTGVSDIKKHLGI